MNQSVWVSSWMLPWLGVIQPTTAWSSGGPTKHVRVGLRPVEIRAEVMRRWNEGQKLQTRLREQRRGDENLSNSTLQRVQINFLHSFSYSHLGGLVSHSHVAMPTVEPAYPIGVIYLFLFCFVLSGHLGLRFITKTDFNTASHFYCIEKSLPACTIISPSTWRHHSLEIACWKWKNAFVTVSWGPAADHDVTDKPISMWD